MATDGIWQFQIQSGEGFCPPLCFVRTERLRQAQAEI